MTAGNLGASLDTPNGIQPLTHSTSPPRLEMLDLHWGHAGFNSPEGRGDAAVQSVIPRTVLLSLLALPEVCLNESHLQCKLQVSPTSQAFD